KQAVKWNLLQRNPSELVELPKVPHVERRVLMPDEALSFLEAANEMPHGLIFEVALLSGMRPEEYLALQWADLDFERGTAQVKRALVRHKGGWSFQETKTARSRRTVSLPKPLFQKLKAHKTKPRIRLYDLRHSHATLLLLADENPKIVAERLGHSTVVLTLDTYSHVLPTMQQQTTAKLTKMLYDGETTADAAHAKRFGTQ
ncbi:MAG: site-specific integrase, partial [Pyrinomonadaceae bacterium]